MDVTNFKDIEKDISVAEIGIWRRAANAGTTYPRALTDAGTIQLRRSKSEGQRYGGREAWNRRLEDRGRKPVLQPVRRME